MRDLASVVTIATKNKMFEKDRICVVTFEELGYEAIVPIEHNIGDKMVFIQEGAILPIDEKWEFLRKSANTFCQHIPEQCELNKKYADVIEQALLNKSKKEQGFDIVLQIIFSDMEDKKLMPYSLFKATEEEFGKDSKEANLMKDLLKEWLE